MKLENKNGEMVGGLVLHHPMVVYCERRYFRAAKFSRINPDEAFLCSQIFVQIASNYLCAFMIYFFNHTIFLRIQSPVRHARNYELRKNVKVTKD